MSLCALAIAAAVAAAPTSAQQGITLAEARIARSPSRAEPWNDLAMALARRARETGDPAFYARADEAIARSLTLAPGNLEARKARAWVLLGRHEFESALALAEELQKTVPDDLQVYGYLADATAELGRYDRSEEAVQWMLNLRPGNVPGLTRAAYLRELFGDVDGAIELMAMAFELTSPAEAEDRAWILTQLAHLNLLVARRDEAEALLDQAFELVPDYHYALAARARLRRGQSRHEEAARLLEARYRQAPHPENLYDWAVALEAAGRSAEARDAFARFEEEARAEAGSNDNANRELAFYLADQGGRPEEALAVARREAARRQDVTTREALAWALHRTGRHEEAGREIEAALAVGFREARLLFRAGIIAAARGDAGASRRHLEDSLRLDPRSEVAAEARQALAALPPPPAGP
jgi:tetratricopeptide (TPR) repeat protein